MIGKPITEMSDEELDSEIERLRAVPIPSPIAKANRPKRLDATPKRKKSLIDFTDEV